MTRVMLIDVDAFTAEIDSEVERRKTEINELINKGETAKASRETAIVVAMNKIASIMVKNSIIEKWR